MIMIVFFPQLHLLDLLLYSIINNLLKQMLIQELQSHISTNKQILCKVHKIKDDQILYYFIRTSKNKFITSQLMSPIHCYNGLLPEIKQMDQFVFDPHEKRTSSSHRKLKRTSCNQKSVRQEANQIFKIPILKALGQKIFLTNKTHNSKLTRKNEIFDQLRNDKNKMIIVAKKIGCFIETPMFLQGIKGTRKDDIKLLEKKSIKKQEQNYKRDIKQLESTMTDSQLKITKFQPPMSQQEYRFFNNSFPKTLRTVAQDSKQSSRYLTFLILSCKNNQQLVRRVLCNRKFWKQVKRGEGIPNFRWLAGDYDHAVFQKSKSTPMMKKVINQFQFHHQITSKNGLIRNLQIYTQTKKLQLFSMTPITFVIDFDQQYCQFNLRQFLLFFLKNHTKNKQSSFSPSKFQPYQKVQTFIQKFRPYFNPHPQLRKKLNPLSRPELKQQYINGDSYLWLLKPTGLNRGRGIQIFQSLEDLQIFLLKYLSLSGRKPYTQQFNNKTLKKQSCGNVSTLPSLQTQSENPSQLKKASEQFILKSCSFVIQKYIEKPMLLGGRKFDIRVWLFLNYDFTLYFFKEGYLRTSSQQFSLDISNYFIHLTNNAIQKHSKQYGQIESGNQISFKTFKQILNSLGHLHEFDKIISKIKQYSYTSLNSVKNKLNPRQQKYCFQLFGFDYIIDQNYKVWLIEVNNNPCIELSSPLLEELIPRMLNDAFRLSLDKIYKEKQRDFTELQNNEKPEIFSVEGYNDSQNMWEDLGKLYPNSEYIPK